MTVDYRAVPWGVVVKRDVDEGAVDERAVDKRAVEGWRRVARRRVIPFIKLTPN